MPIFEYKGLNTNGGVVSGMLDADTSREARSQLRKDNIRVTDITQTTGKDKEKGPPEAPPKDGHTVAEPIRRLEFLKPSTTKPKKLTRAQVHDHAKQKKFERLRHRLRLDLQIKSQ